MKFKVIVPPEVFEEIEKSIEYYESKIDNLGTIF